MLETLSSVGSFLRLPLHEEPRVLPSGTAGTEREALRDSKRVLSGLFNLPDSHCLATQRPGHGPRQEGEGGTAISPRHTSSLF